MIVSTEQRAISGARTPMARACLESTGVRHEAAKPDDRILIALRYERDLKLSDIADLLGIPTGTVKWRLHAAHEQLRWLLERTEGGSR